MRYRLNSLRLTGYDYSRAGIYFITLCVKDREHLFGKIIDKKMILNLFGRIVHTKWNNIPRHFKNAQLDAFQIMPDHFHAIIILSDFPEPAKHSGPNNDPHIEPAQAKHFWRYDYQNPQNFDKNVSPQINPHPPNGTKPGSLSAIVQNFSSITTRKINQIRKTPGRKIWQRSFHDRIVWDPTQLWIIRRYILNNPANWNKRK